MSRGPFACLLIATHAAQAKPLHAHRGLDRHRTFTCTVTDGAATPAKATLTITVATPTQGPPAMSRDHALTWGVAA